MTENEIKLAVAMGWKPRKVSGVDGDTWFNPGGHLQMPPRPTENASDCEDVIAWLMTQGWHVEVKFQSYPWDTRDAEYVGAFGVFLHIWHVDTEQHERTSCDLDVWKRCLCDLAARVTDRQTLDK